MAEKKNWKYRLGRQCPPLFDLLLALKRKGKFKPKCDWTEEERIKGDMADYERGHGHSFDWDHPVAFTEKLLHYKRVFKGDGHLDRVVDKINFKSYIEEKLGPGYTIPLIKYWSSLKDFKKDWDSLPNAFVLKSSINHSGVGVYIVPDKSKADFKDICFNVHLWLKPENTSLNSYGSAYYNTVPRVLCEEYRSNIAGQLFDYKLFCFDGKPYYVYAAVDHFGEDGSHISFYDLDWNQLNVSYGDHKVEPVQKPVHFEEMKEIAAKLSQGFPFLRVDFFDTGDNLYLAKMTLYPGGGHTPYHPQSFDIEMGSHFNLPEE